MFVLKTRPQTSVYRFSGEKAQYHEGRKKHIFHPFRGAKRKVEIRRQTRTLHSDHKSDIERLQRSYDRDVAAKQTELDRITLWFPDVPQLAATADYCREVGFSREQTQVLLTLKPVEYTGKLRSPKSGRSYEADSVTARLEKRHSTSGSGFTLTINGTPILQWFKLQFEKVGKFARQTILPQQDKSRGI